MTEEVPSKTTNAGSDIAIIGMAARLPAANDIAQFWDNLRRGVDCMTHYSDEELSGFGLAKEAISAPNFVKVGAPIEGMEDFDAAFFGFSPLDASIMDPQHRHFLECSHAALEHAGYDSHRYNGAIGIFAGSGHNEYLAHNVESNPELMSSVGYFLARHTGNDKDFLTTRVAYLLNLRGPAINVQTACSTSLVAIHLAVQSLLSGECDIALAGGVTLDFRSRHGYVFHEGEILSSDGRCRAFDAASDGTVFGSGAGVVALKRLDEAIADRDTIHAVIKGTAVNNDGSAKVGYLAPSIEGQTAAVVEALSIAGVDPRTVTYVETHGTGTTIGDPIEVAALTDAFQTVAQDWQVELPKGYCSIGSVKTNIGHLDTAAGVAGIIKTVLSLEHEQLPASLHYQSPNPQIDFENAPFRVNSGLRDWPNTGSPRRASVGSLGVGGTNAHVVLEEAPPQPVSGTSRSHQLLLLSAKTESALDLASSNLADHLRSEPSLSLPDVAYTLQVGRQSHQQRRFVVAKDSLDALAVLKADDRKRVVRGGTPLADCPVTFMFPGQGAQYPDMGRGLYKSEPVFRDAVDQCVEILKSHLDIDLLEVLYPTEASLDLSSELLRQTALAQPAIFVVEYALAKLWMSWGIRPEALIGHSIGQYVAACLADVFSLHDSLRLVAKRGKLMQGLPAGAMIVVSLGHAQCRAKLSEALSIAAINEAGSCVVAGPLGDVDQFVKQLESEGIHYQRLHTSHAFHSAMMDPILDEFADEIAKAQCQAPKIPIVSNVTGTWMTDAEAVEPQSWANQIRRPVHFADGLEMLFQTRNEQILLEVGPGQTLTTFAKQHKANGAGHRVHTSMRHPKDSQEDLAVLLDAVGHLWSAGVEFDWSGFYAEESRNRVPLPTYPFEHQRYWIEPGKQPLIPDASKFDLSKRSNLDQWFYRPCWQQLPLERNRETRESRLWLLFVDEIGIGETLAQRLIVEGDEVILVRIGEHFEKNENGFAINPAQQQDHANLIDSLSSSGRVPDGILYAWAVFETDESESDLIRYQNSRARCFDSLMYLAQAIAGASLLDPIEFNIIANELHDVSGSELVAPEKSLALGPVLVLPQEFPNLVCRTIDVGLPKTERGRRKLVDQVATELNSGSSDAMVALRGNLRWVRSYQDQTLSKSIVEADHPSTVLRTGGVYLITGGLGGIGLAIAQELAETIQAKLILVGRSQIPDREQWDELVRSGDCADKTVIRIRAIQKIEESGAEVLVVCADVTNMDEMSQVVAETKRKFGVIHGAFHTAGILDDELVPFKSIESANAVLASKIEGALVLDTLMCECSLDFVVLFSSISSVLGFAGQIDYASANAYLDALASNRSNRDETRVVAINWGIWQDVGMAAEMATARGLLKRPIPDESWHSVADSVWNRKAFTAGKWVYSAEISTDCHWLVDEHRLSDGQAILPGTGYLELVRSAIADVSNCKSIEMTDVVFATPFGLTNSETKTLEIQWTAGESPAPFEIGSGSGPSELTHVTGQVAVVASEPPVPICLDRILLPMKLDSSLATDKGGEHLSFGPRWNNFRALHIGDGEALLELAIPAEFAHDLDQYKLHPALLDIATAGVQTMIPGFDAKHDFYVPFSYGRLRMFESLPERIFSHVRIVLDENSESDFAAFDLTITDCHGNVLVEIESFTMRRVREPMRLDNSSLSLEPSRILSKTDQDFMDALESGISLDEGIDALGRILNSPSASHVIVSPVNLHGLIARSKASADPKETGTATHARPDSVCPYVAPETEVQKQIAAIWKEAFGIDRVGIDDDFFDLGGHSFLATQVTAKMSKTLGIKFSLRTLFDTPTIAEFTKAIQGQTQTDPANTISDAQWIELAPRLLGILTRNSGTRQ